MCYGVSVPKTLLYRDRNLSSGAYMQKRPVPLSEVCISPDGGELILDWDDN
jgi:hypothetical protein